MQKLKLLIPLTIQFSIRYVLRTGLLGQLAQNYEPIVVLGWSDKDLFSEFKSLGIACYFLPNLKINKKYGRVRQKIGIYHFDKIGSPSTEIDRQRNLITLSFKEKLINTVKNNLVRLEIFGTEKFSSLFTMENKLLNVETNFSDFLQLIEKIKPDALFCLTPYLLEEEFLIRAAVQHGVKTCTAILSFDNLTTRGWIPILFDAYFLWNQYNVNELKRIYPQATTKRIKIVGAPQFDFYYDESYIWNGKQWRKTLGLPEDRPVILFGAGPQAIAPIEPHWLEQLDNAIETGEIEGRPIILLRRHPVDPVDRWEPLFGKLKNLIVDEAWKDGVAHIAKTNITRWDIEKLASTLKHSFVHINTSSTMTIDGAIFDRPQIGFAYDDTENKKFDQAMRELYLREHYLPITNSGGLKLVFSRAEMVQAVNYALKNPSFLSEERKKIISEICTFDDGKSACRVAEAVHEFLG